jgi:hypothetical protein
MRSIAICLALLTASVANAAIVKYEYTGAKYDYYADGSNDPLFEFNPYVGIEQDYMTGWFLLDTSLLPGGTNKNISVELTAYDFEECAYVGEICPPVIPDHYFFDGLYEQSPRAEYPSFRAPGNLFTLETDAHGDLVSWAIYFMDDEVYDQWITSNGDRRYFPPCGDTFFVTNICVKNRQAGTWRQVPVPEPSALALLAIGLFAALQLRRLSTQVRSDCSARAA